MGDLWYAGGVASAVGAVRSANSLLLVFSARVDNGDGAEELLGRTATRVMEKTTFGSREVRDAVTRHRVICLKLRADPADEDYANFSALFPVDAAPCIHVVAPDGKVLLQRAYHTSPGALCRALDYAHRLRAAGDAEVPAPDLGPPFHEPQPLAPEAEERWERAKAAREEAVKRAAEKAAVAATVAASAEEATPPASVLERKVVEPAAGSTSEVTRALPASASALQLGNRTRLQVRLAGGETTTRTFDVSTPLSVVAAWVGEEAGTGDMPTLAVAFPRRQFDAADASKTLSELALTPSATLIVLSSAGATSAGAGAAAGAQAAGGRAGGVVSAVRGVVGVAGSFLGSFVGSTPAPETVDENEERR